MNHSKLTSRIARPSKVENISKISRLYVPREMDNKLNEWLDCLHHASSPLQRPKCIWLTGEAGVGKTTFLHQFAARCAGNDIRGRDEQSAIYMSVPAGGSASGLMKKMLDLLGMGRLTASSNEELGRLLQESLRMRGVRTILVDEVQNLLNMENRDIRKGVDFLNHLARDLEVSCVISGLPSSRKILNFAPDLTSYCQEVHMEGFSDSSPADLRSFRMWLQAIDKKLPFTRHLGIANPIVAQEIYAATQGNPGQVIRLIQEASFSVIEAGRDYLNEGDLENGFSAVGFFEPKRVRVIAFELRQECRRPLKTSHPPTVNAGVEISLGNLRRMARWLKTALRKAV